MGIFRCEDFDKCVLLKFKAVGQRTFESGVDHTLCDCVRLHRTSSEHCCEFHRPVFEFLWGHNLIGEADSQRFIGSNLTSAENEILGSRWTNETRQPLRSSPARAELDVDAWSVIVLRRAP